MSLKVFQQRILPMKDKLYRLAFRLLQNVQEAEDDVQEIMIRIWTKRKEWGQWESMEAYCMISVRNSCLDRLRKQRLRPVQESKARDIRSPDKDPQEKIMAKEATIKSVFRYRNIYPKAINAIAKGIIDVSGIVTHEFDFADTAKAFDFVINNKNDVVKAVIKIG